MTTVAIISEYNPFHNGHLYQIEKIRKEFGEDTAIVAIMSGNYTQRGEIAIMDKWKRAEAAVMCGVNLVLELPFPYSASSAEFFARAGVHIANKLGVVDYLSFGSESGDISELLEISENMLSESFDSELKKIISNEKYENVGYPKQLQVAYENAFSKTLSGDAFSPNNILAFEYIKALKKSKSKIMPHTIKRVGADYSDDKIVERAEHQSATAIRELLLKGISATNYIPNDVADVYSSEQKKDAVPCDANQLSSAILSHLMLNDPKAERDIHDAKGGLYNRLKKMSFEAKDISSLIVLSETKKYTTARIRRAIWYSYFGVTSSDVRELPTFTQVLALDKVGRILLKNIETDEKFGIITKPSSCMRDALGERQKQLSDKADILFQLSKPKRDSGNSVYKRTPFVKK